MKAIELANFILNLDTSSESDITPMKLQKLMYFAHGFHLAITGQPLIDSGFCALKAGPVNKQAYLRFKNYGRNAIVERGKTIIIKDKKSEQIIKDVFKFYNQFSATKLSQLTHAPDSPWSKSFTTHENRSSISDEEIKNYFLQKKESFIEDIEDFEDQEAVLEFEKNRDSIERVSISDL